MLGKFWQRNAHPWWRRARTSLRLLFTASLAKTHGVHFISINGCRYKRIRFGDSWEARENHHNLEAVAHLDVFPAPVLRHENELWVAFVAGSKLDASRPETRSLLATFFVALYSTGWRRVASEETRLQLHLERDLAFLRDIGVLERQLAAELLALSHTQRPARLILGFDYIDPLAKNFVVADGRAVAVDIDSLKADQQLGTGLAKARLHWLADDMGAFVDNLVVAGAPDLRPQLAYAELCFLAEWTKMKVLQGKRRYVRPENFRDYLRRHGA